MIWKFSAVILLVVFSTAYCLPLAEKATEAVAAPETVKEPESASIAESTGATNPETVKEPESPSTAESAGSTNPETAKEPGSVSGAESTGSTDPEDEKLFLPVIQLTAHVRPPPPTPPPRPVTQTVVVPQGATLDIMAGQPVTIQSTPTVVTTVHHQPGPPNVVISTGK